ncbi:hypothetical protein PBN151_3035 [Paenibacillus sp. NAIST15-1]|nr:hypothetical protein PBN151_3035 [Paenibacillus sp. NAIST15-1]
MTIRFNCGLRHIQWKIGGLSHLTCDDSGYLIPTYSDEDTDIVEAASVSVTLRRLDWNSALMHIRACVIQAMLRDGPYID